jgi:hypothetical protein
LQLSKDISDSVMDHSYPEVKSILDIQL